MNLITPINVQEKCVFSDNLNYTIQKTNDLSKQYGYTPSFKKHISLNGTKNKSGFKAIGLATVAIATALFSNKKENAKLDPVIAKKSIFNMSKDEIKNASAEEIFDLLGIKYEKDKHDGKFIISHFDNRVTKYNRLQDEKETCSLTSLGINVNELLKEVKSVEKDFTIYANDNLNLNNLQHVGGNLHFSGIPSVVLDNLKSVGGNLSLMGCNNVDIGVKSVGDRIHIMSAENVKLPNLRFAKNIDFCDVKNSELSSIESVIESVELVNHSVNTSIKLDNLRNIGKNLYISSTNSNYTGNFDISNLKSLGGKLTAMTGPHISLNLNSLKAAGEIFIRNSEGNVNLKSLKSVEGNAVLSGVSSENIPGLNQIGGVGTSDKIKNINKAYDREKIAPNVREAIEKRIKETDTPADFIDNVKDKMLANVRLVIKDAIVADYIDYHDVLYRTYDTFNGNIVGALYNHKKREPYNAEFPKFRKENILYIKDMVSNKYIRVGNGKINDFTPEDIQASICALADGKGSKNPHFYVNRI